MAFVPPTDLPPDAVWTPGPEVTDLTGEPLPPDADFDVAPPPEIGRVLAAWTPARVGKPGRPRWMKWVTVLAVPAAVFLIGGALLDRAVLPKQQDENLHDLLACLSLILVGLLAWLVFRNPNKYIWYVADGGMARALVGRPGKPQYVLKFADAVGLRAGQTKQYYNGIYVGTRYSYFWYDAQGTALYKLKGSYNSNKKAIGSNNAFRYGVTGEAIWNVHYRQRAAAELEATGAITFPVNRKDYVRVGPDRLEFFMKGEQVAIEKTDIAGIALSSGTFTVRHKDAKWYKRGGKYSFNYAAMSNAQMFVFALEKLLGYKFD